MSGIVLSTAYLGPVQYFAHLLASPRVVVDTTERYAKQTYRNRCVIAGPQGPQVLSVPVEHGASAAATRDVRLSPHGRWQHVHWAALVTAYDASPYFELLADDFRRVYEHPYTFLADFNEALLALVCDVLALPLPALHADAAEPLDPTLADLRAAISPKASAPADARFRPEPYYQVFAQRHGFLPNLSIADLLFNLGPEARIVLRRSLSAATP